MRRALIIALVGLILISFLEWQINNEISHYQTEEQANQYQSTALSGPVFLGLRDELSAGWHWIGSNDKELLVVFTAALFLVTALLVRYTKKLWGSTSNLVEDANIAEAPFILPDQVFGEGFLRETTHGARIIYGFKNHGKSPAIIRRWRDFSMFTEQLPPTPSFQEKWSSRPEHYIPVAAGENGGLLAAHAPPGITRKQVLDGRKSKKWFYVIGEVEYEDIFGIIRVQGYCLKISHISEDHEGIGLLDKVHFLRDGGRAYNNRYHRD